MRCFKKYVLSFVLVTTALCATTAQGGDLRDPVEFRAMWADAFQAGFKSTSQISSLVTRAQIGRYNAIIVEVMAYQDIGVTGHGAYWDSDIVPHATDVSGGIDPLATLVQTAHAANIEVHAWIVPYRVCNSWPPSGNSYLAARDHWLMVEDSDMGGGPAKVDGHYVFDTGAPEVQEYLISIVREIVSNYEVDGIHLDYIRHTVHNAGYPARTWYTQSGLERFKAITGYVGTPPYSDNDWEDFRRREIDEFVRRCYTETHVTESPQQPLRQTAALICSGDAPSNFTSSDAYNLFQNWKYWLEQGWLDAACPMNYKREHCSSQATWFRNWVDAAVGWGSGRHVFCGQANYLNSFDNSITQMEYIYNAGADGSVNYSYAATRSTETLCDDVDNSVNDISWYSYLALNLFTSTATTPDMPWHDPATATKGAVYGRIVDGATGNPVDNASVKLGAFTVAQTDGNGFYLYIPPFTIGTSGTTIPLNAEHASFGSASRPAVLVTRGTFTEVNFALGTWLDGDYDVDLDVDKADFNHFGDCITGPEAGPPAGGCDIFDFDNEGDVDLDDFRVFQDAFTG